MIPDTVEQHIQQAVGRTVTSAQRVSGGSINQAAQVTLDDDTVCFLKWNTSADPQMFVVEEQGLALLTSADTSLRIPPVLATGQTDSGTGFLLQQFVLEGRSKPNSASDFGRALAQLHSHHNETFGLDHDNFIGRLPQSNTPHDSWVDFFIRERMEPQLRMATDSGKLGSATVNSFKAMYKQLPDIFPDEPPSLLHGDLWGGNYFFDQDGKATIYDPAVYYGHREIELAFTHLFGGFPSNFYRAYEEAYPLSSGFSRRKDIYNLYPLLVHTNLFGGSYARQVEGIVQQF
jgi:fructosamine-3-kinase